VNPSSPSSISICIHRSQASEGSAGVLDEEAGVALLAYVHDRLQAGADRLVVDLERIESVDLAGFDALVDCAWQARALHGRLRVACPGSKLDRSGHLPRRPCVPPCLSTRAWRLRWPG
jgi:ABC-type transporter Mla MlaB component